MKLEFAWQIFDRTSNFVNISPVWAVLFLSDTQTSINDRADSRFSKFYERTYRPYVLNDLGLLVPIKTMNCPQ